jgi:REP element-mobilizing transposase RayT
MPSLHPNSPSLNPNYKLSFENSIFDFDITNASQKAVKINNEMQSNNSENHIQFFTATILYWQQLLKENRYKQIIIDSLRFLTDEKRITVYAFVIMPNHIHLLWKINEGHKRETVQRDFLRFTAQKIKQDLQNTNSSDLSKFYVNLSDRQYQFWERNALSIDIYSREVLEQKLDYIHNNPLKQKWLSETDDQACFYSSASFYQQDDNCHWTFLTHYMNAC